MSYCASFNNWISFRSEVGSSPSSALDPVGELRQISTLQELLSWKQSHQVTKELIDEAMTIVRRLLDSGDFDSAAQLSDWCLLLAEDFNEVKTLAQAKVTKGITLARASEDILALSYFDEAIRLFERAGDELSSAKVRLNRIKCYCDLCRYDEALHDGETSKDVFTRLGETHLLARGLNNLGTVFFRLDRFQEWLGTLNEAAKLLQATGDDKSLAMVYWNYAVALTSLNRGAEAVEYYQHSNALALKTGQTWIAATTNYNLGYLLYTQGKYTQALEILMETRASLSADQWHLPLCDLTQGEIYLEINMYRDAVLFAEAAYRGFASIGKPFEMAKAIGVMAIARSQLQEFKEAQRLFQQAKAMFKEQGNDVRAAGMDLYRAVMWLEMGDRS